MGYSPWGHKELDTTTTFISFFSQCCLFLVLTISCLFLVSFIASWPILLPRSERVLVSFFQKYSCFFSFFYFIIIIIYLTILYWFCHIFSSTLLHFEGSKLKLAMHILLAYNSIKLFMNCEFLLISIVESILTNFFRDFEEYIFNLVFHQ